ncbi:hypothetical protein [Flavobacterium sp. MMS24-S5]|uniref:hypothetical protein n=1 Tax=Flavobacterium sp. MMS24-S5 TaxID=3416605 RepID=UPI003CFFD100
MLKHIKAIMCLLGSMELSKDFNHALIAAGVVIFPVAITEGLLVSAFTLSGEMSVGAIGGRMAVDASVQTAVNFSSNGGDFGNAFGRVNLTQTALAGVGMNYMGNALLSSSTNISLIDQKSIFNGTMSGQSFATQTIFSAAGGAAAQKMSGSSWFKGTTLGTDMITTVRFGQSVGNVAGNITNGLLTNAPVYGAGVIQNKIQ